MKINKIRLKNYVGVYNGTGVKDMVLNFKDIKIILICGENGSGKSSIMSTLHPLADSKSIRPGKKGLKEIELEDNGMIYQITHHYTPTSKDTHTTKSYIKMIDPSGNEQELNENGNVTSFLSIIDELMGVNNEYLSMVRLGSSFTSFIDKSSAERSKFISKFLSEINVYLKHFKKLTDDSRVLKNMIQNVTNKLDTIGDYENLLSRLKKISNDLNKTNNEITDINNKLYMTENLLESLPDIVTQDIEELDTINIEKNISSLNEYFKVDILNSFKSDFKNIVSNYKNTIDRDLERAKDTLKDVMSKVSEYDDSIDELECNIELIDEEECNDAIIKYSNKVTEVKLLIEEYGFSDEKNIPKFTKSELFQGSQLLDDYLFIIDELHSNYSDREFSILESNIDVDRNQFLSDYNKATADVEKLTITLNDMVAEKSSMMKHYKLIEERYAKKPDTCMNFNCPLLGGDINQYEVNISRLETEINEIEDKINEITKDRILYGNLIDIIDERDKIFKSISRNWELFKKLPFNVENDFIYDMFLSGKELYDAKVLEKHSDIVEVYNRVLGIQNDIKDLYVYYVDSKKALENLVIYKSELKAAKSGRELYYNKLSGIKETRDNIQYMKDNINEILDNMDDYLDYVKYIENKEYMIEISNKTKRYKSDIKQFKEGLQYLNKYKEDLSKEFSDLSYKETLYGKLKAERKILKDKFADVEIVKKAMSSTKGIPLVYIDLYLQQVRILANGLLEEAFNDILKLEDFVINNNEFRIPFSRREYVDDIKSGSAGERSIVSLVMSFAFISQISSTFNIMFLDEVDGPLDKRNRKSFANAVETQMDIMGMEQCFIISHNDSFLTKNVGYILLKDHSLDNVDENNIIFEY